MKLEKKHIRNFSTNRNYQLNELTPIDLLESIKPNIHFISSDWSKNPIEKFTVENNGGKYP